MRPPEIPIRSFKLLNDADLATLYGVPTKRLNEQVYRNARRFPADFVFQLNRAERDEVVANCNHLPQPLSDQQDVKIIYRATLAVVAFARRGKQAVTRRGRI